MSMVKQLAAEATSILTSASFQPDGRLTKSPYTGPKLDGSDYPMVTIEPKIDIEAPTLIPASTLLSPTSTPLIKFPSLRTVRILNVHASISTVISPIP